MPRSAPTITFRLSDFVGDNPPAAQLEFVEAPEPEVAWIGGVGGGKTVGLCAKAIMVMLRYPGSRVIIARRTYDELIKTTKQTFFRVAEPLKKAGLVDRPRNWDYMEQTNYLRLTTGAEVHFSNLEDETKFRNVEATWIGVDQAEENDLDFMLFVKSRIRQTFRQREVPPAGRQFCVIANDEGHNWIWRRYCPESVGVSSRRHFVHSTSLENSYLDPETLKDLLDRPPAWVNQFVYARMDSSTGRLLPDPMIVGSCYPPPETDVYLAVDHGESTVCCAHWGFENTTEHSIPPGILPGGTCVFREYWMERADIEAHCRNITAMCQKLKIVSKVMDHTAFRLTQSKIGGIRRSIADIYRDGGLILTPSVGNPEARVERINVVHGRGLYITKDCPNYIRQAPGYHTKVNRRTGLPDIVNKSTYHAVDSMGYLLMSMPNSGSRARMEWDPDDLPPHLRPEAKYWQETRDEVSRQFAVANYRDKGRDSNIVDPYGATYDDFWHQAEW